MLTIWLFLLIILIVIEKKAMYPHPPDCIFSYDRFQSLMKIFKNFYYVFMGGY